MSWWMSAWCRPAVYLHIPPVLLMPPLHPSQALFTAAALLLPPYAAAYQACAICAWWPHLGAALQRLAV